MTYQISPKISQFRFWRRAVFFAAVSLALAGCDSGTGGTSADSTATDAADTSTAASTAAGTATEASTTNAEVQINVVRDENGVATGEIIVGDPDAPVEMIEYLSVTCSHCARHHTNVWPEIKERWVVNGQLKVKFIFWPRGGPLDELISMVALCGPDERVYPVMDLILSRQGQWLRGNAQEALNNVAGLVRRAGISRAEFDTCVRTPELLANIRTMFQSGLDEGVNGTPYFIIGGETFSGEWPIEKFEEVINGEL